MTGSMVARDYIGIGGTRGEFGGYRLFIPVASAVANPVVPVHGLNADFSVFATHLRVGGLILDGVLRGKLVSKPVGRSGIERKEKPLSRLFRDCFEEVRSPASRAIGVCGWFGACRPHES